MMSLVKHVGVVRRIDDSSFLRIGRPTTACGCNRRQTRTSRDYSCQAPLALLEPDLSGKQRYITTLQRCPLVERTPAEDEQVGETCSEAGCKAAALVVA